MSRRNPKLDQLQRNVDEAIKRVNSAKEAYEWAKNETTAAKVIGPDAFSFALDRQRFFKGKLDDAFAAQARAIQEYQREREAEKKRWHEKPCTNCGRIRRYRDGDTVPDNICSACRQYRKGMGTPTPLRRNW